MFFNGDLQSGIALAISESKLVACFIRDDEEESSSWEDVYLQDDEIAPLLRSKTVLLRMNTGSQEAGFLSAFCPINKTPTLVIIHNGQLREYLVAGIAPDDFKQRLKAALTEQPSTTHPQDSQATPEPPSQQPTTVSQQSTRLIPAPVQAPAPPDTTPSNATVQNLLHDRRDRLEAEKKRREDAERADRQAKAKARREDAAGAEAGGASPGSFKSQELSYAQQQRKRQQDARQERDRIMRQIENDKADRREREERRRALARAEAGATDGADGLVDQQISSENVQRPASTRSSKDCAVQVRLLDGSTIRSRFPSDQTLRSH
ncbi:MAG: hypothetical protein M1830_008721, partial [Pleopsidium flavum]